MLYDQAMIFKDHNAWFKIDVIQDLKLWARIVTASHDREPWIESL